MSSFPMISPDLLEDIRKRKLAQSLANVAPQVAQSAPPVGADPSIGPPPVQVPPARDQAAQGYRQAIAQPPPQRSDYQPSLGRKIGGIALGVLSGIRNPERGYETAEGIMNEPYNKKLSEYQQNLAQKKDIFEQENKASEEVAKEGELGEQKKAEVARAGAEEERKKGEAYKNSPEGQAFELKKATIEHPANATQDFEPYVLELTNGEKLPVSFNKRTGMYTDPVSGTKIEQDSKTIKSADKVGTVSQNTPKALAGSKPPALGTLADYIKDKYGDKATPEQKLQAKEEYNRAGAIGSQTPEKAANLAATTNKDYSGIAQASYNKQSDILDRDLKPITDQLNKLDNVNILVDQKTAQADAEVFQTLIQGLLGGVGSNFRMTQPEINAAAGGRTAGEAVTALTNKFKSGQAAQIPDEQRAAVKKVVAAMKNKAQAQEDLINNTHKALGDPKADEISHRKIMDDYRDKRSKLLNPKVEEKSDKTATTQHVNDYAKQKGITPEQAKKEFEAAGYEVK